MQMSELLPCPFCGGEVELTTYRDEGYIIECKNHDWPKAENFNPISDENIAGDIQLCSWGLGDEAKKALITAWNTRAELGSDNADADDALALLDEIREAGRISYDDYSQLFDAIAAWNSRAERTCKMETDHDELEVIAYSHEDTWAYKCSACDWSFRYDRGIKPNYCPSCGCKVVGE